MIHILYRTENLLNGKFYVGMHSCHDINDGYFGSGKILRYALNKYGKHNFKRIILNQCDSRAELAQMEKQVVTQQLLSDPLCMNLKLGGEGGGCIGSGCGRKKGSTHTDEAKHKIRLANLGRVGHSPTVERRLQIGLEHRGLTHPAAVRAKISKASIITHSETWKITHNEKSFIVTNLKQFCRDRKLKYTTLLLASKKSRSTSSGFLVEKIK